MRLKTEQESNLNSIVNAVAQVEGVLAVILFGSRAKGNYDEYSDYDLLVVFENDQTMWKNRRELYEKVGRLGLFTQVLTRTLKELWEKTEPTFLKDIFEHGVILYLRYPPCVPALLQTLRRMAIITYSLKSLTQKEKMKIIYKLFGKQNLKKMVEQRGGRKLGDGCFMIPIENLEEVTRTLKQYNVRFETLTVYEQIQNR
ncbi:MAG: nucleotidyltransferase domain-containing protein [Candidatus Jordarchaeum sp.]|uniref:nucleotidyltransferase domain-containing protein n=1 Tax=Candidatus Jordarchaeum sp. TaxID=2823881 RepID=UPI004049F162